MRQEGYSSGYRIAKGGLTSHKQVCLCVRACAFRLCTCVFFVSVLVRACVPADCAGSLTEHKQGYVHAVFGQDHHISRAVAALGTMSRCVCTQLHMCPHETHIFAHVRMMPTTPCALKCRYALRAILECVCCMNAESAKRGPEARSYIQAALCERDTVHRQRHTCSHRTSTEPTAADTGHTGRLCPRRSAMFSPHLTCCSTGLVALK